MATVVSRHVPPSWIFFKFIFSKTASKFFEIGRKHAFTPQIWHIMKNRMKKKKLEQIFVKTLQFSILNFNLHS